MNVYLTHPNLQKINFQIENESAYAEVQGKCAYVYIGRKKITLMVGSGPQAMDRIETYLHRHKDRIEALLKQHSIIESVYHHRKQITLLEGGRFQYFSPRDNKLVTTSLREEYTRLQEKLRENGQVAKWQKKAEKIKKAIEVLGGSKKLLKASSQDKVIVSSENNFKFSHTMIRPTELKTDTSFAISNPSDKYLNTVKKKTRKRMREPHSLKEVKLYKGTKIEFKDKALLQPNEILEVPIKIDFNHTWTPLFYSKKEGSLWAPEEPIKVRKKNPKDALSPGKKLAYQTPLLTEYQKPQNTFFCHYVPNVLESPYFRERRFDENKYLDSLGVFFLQALKAQKASGADQILWNPLGMGAALKGLAERDAKYRDSKALAELKYKIALKFREQFEQPEFKRLQLHLCIPTGEGLNDQLQAEAIANYNAFILAFTSADSKIRQRLTIHRNTDIAMLAQNLAEKLGSGKVSMIYETSPHSLENDWLKHPVKENVHCRSSLAASVASYLDRSNNIEKRIYSEGGKIVEI
jgi:hypothetical protein